MRSRWATPQVSWGAPLVKPWSPRGHGMVSVAPGPSRSVGHSAPPLTPGVSGGNRPPGASSDSLENPPGAGPLSTHLPPPLALLISWPCSSVYMGGICAKSAEPNPLLWTSLSALQAPKWWFRRHELKSLLEWFLAWVGGDPLILQYKTWEFTPFWALARVSSPERTVWFLPK